MNISKKLLLAAVVLPLSLGSASSFAFGGKDHDKGRDRAPMLVDMHLLKKLDLTDEQKDELKELRAEKKEQRKEMRQERRRGNPEDMKQQHQMLQELLFADSFDEAKAQEFALKMSQKHADREVKRLKEAHRILSILTPEQKQELQELQKERAEKRAEKMRERMEERDA
ncbi:CpxP family protein [Marinomonas epiphytica]